MQEQSCTRGESVQGHGVTSEAEYAQKLKDEMNRSATDSSRLPLGSGLIVHWREGLVK